VPGHIDPELSSAFYLSAARAVSYLALSMGPRSWKALKNMSWMQRFYCIKAQWI